MRRLIAMTAMTVLTGCHQDGRHAEAKALIGANCTACHIVPGVRGGVGRVGPSLEGIARQQLIAGQYPNRPDVMTRWLMHPQAMRAGSGMPEMGLSQDQATKIAAYLYTLDR